MPAVYLMNWGQKNALWRIRYNDHEYTCSCRKLTAWSGKPVPKTKEGSYQYANAWWLERKAELDARPVKHPHSDYILELERRLNWSERHGAAKSIRILKHELKRIKAGGELNLHTLNYGKWSQGGPPEITAYAAALNPGEAIEDVFFNLNPESAIWRDRLDRDSIHPTPQVRTIGGNIAKYVENREKLALDSKKSVSNYAQIERCLRVFGEWFGPGNEVDILNEDKIDQWFNHLLSWKQTDGTKEKYFSEVRQFVRWLACRKLIALPGNINDRNHRFTEGVKDFPVFTIAEARTLIDHADGQHRLHFLLMVNCGYTQVDIAKLRHDQVDWEIGRIIRKRSKTGRFKNVPTVNYKLWPLTFQLLKEYRSSHSELALTTPEGGPLLIECLVKGKPKKYDRLKNHWEKFVPRLNKRLTKAGTATIIGKPMKSFRKTSATILGTHDVYCQCVDEFLGHTPQTIADRHYKAPDPNRFDRAVLWLGQRYGYVEE